MNACGGRPASSIRSPRRKIFAAKPQASYHQPLLMSHPSMAVPWVVSRRDATGGMRNSVKRNSRMLRSISASCESTGKRRLWKEMRPPSRPHRARCRCDRTPHPRYCPVPSLNLRIAARAPRPRALLALHCGLTRSRGRPSKPTTTEGPPMTDTALDLDIDDDFDPGATPPLTSFCWPRQRDVSASQGAVRARPEGLLTAHPPPLEQSQSAAILSPPPLSPSSAGLNGKGKPALSRS